MDIIKSIDELAMQDPSLGEFSSVDLNWTRFGNTEHYDDVALIPYSRVDNFIVGECSNVESPTQFHIERGRKRSSGSLTHCKSDEYLEYRLYWCSFGPENYGEGGEVLPSRRYRLNTRNRAARPQSMRGCTCHFVVKRLYARSSAALIVYNERRHIDKFGFVCHGPLDKDAIGPGAKKLPYVCSEIQQQTLSMIYLGIPEENVLEKHMEGIQRYCGASNAKLSSTHASQYVQKLGTIIRRSTHELDTDDDASVRMWVDRNKKSVFFYRAESEEPFVLGIQTEWQLQQMLRFGYCSLIASNSTFGVKRFKYPLSTLIVFDSRQRALPVAWVITRSFAKADVCQWMKALLARVRSAEPSWKVSGFLIDDAAAEVDPIREMFCCPILFSVWRLRRSWLRMVIKKCASVEVQREVFRRLGQMVWGACSSSCLDDFLGDFVDQRSFVQYFRTSWMPKLEMWLECMRRLPLGSLEAGCAVEGYHLKLKLKLLCEEEESSSHLQRVDWLVHRLTTEVHSGYWLDRHADETGSFRSVRQEYIDSSPWHQALCIPDAHVDWDGGAFARVRTAEKTHSVFNPGSEFSFCDCKRSSMQGNLCKHVIRLTAVPSRPSHSLSFRSFASALSALYTAPDADSIQLDRMAAWAHRILHRVCRMADLTASHGIHALAVNARPHRWACTRTRTPRRPPNPSVSLPVPAVAKKRKRKRLLRLL